MKRIALALVAAAIVGCSPSPAPLTDPSATEHLAPIPAPTPKPNHEDLRIELAWEREAQWQEFLYLKKHKGNHSKGYRKLRDRAKAFTEKVEREDLDDPELRSLIFLWVSCGFEYPNAIYYFGMQIGEDPTPDAVACHQGISR